jgi:hypothetical protein
MDEKKLDVCNLSDGTGGLQRMVSKRQEGLKMDNILHAVRSCVDDENLASQIQAKLITCRSQKTQVSLKKTRGV